MPWKKYSDTMVANSKEKADKEQSLHAYTRRLQVLHEIDYAILEAHSGEEIAISVLKHLDKLLPNCDWSCVSLFDYERNKVRILAVHTQNLDPFDTGQEFELEACRIAKNEQSNKIHYFADLREVEERTETEELLAKQGLHSFMSVPLVAQSRLIGAVNLSSFKPHVDTSEFVEVAEEISNSLAVAIENSRLLDAERKHNKELVSMGLVSAALRIAKTRSSVPAIILDQILKLFEAKGALFIDYDQGKESALIELGLGIWQRNTGLILDTEKCALLHPLLTKKPYYTNKALENSAITYPELFGNVLSVAFAPMIAQDHVIGVLGLGRNAEISKDDVRLLRSIADMVGSAAHNLVLTEDLKRSHKELTLAYDLTLQGWAKALELRDQETDGHTQRVTDRTVKLARLMGVMGKELDHLRRGVILHDIGKMGIPDSILLKPAKLTSEEWNLMKQHPRYAYEMLAPIPFLAPAIDIPYCHHEKWDGTGYPRQLKGEQIPLAARIFAIVDVYDALTSKGRAYKDAWSKEKALAYVKEQSGKHFDPQVVDAFLKLIS